LVETSKNSEFKVFKSHEEEMMFLVSKFNLENLSSAQLNILKSF